MPSCNEVSITGSTVTIVGDGTNNLVEIIDNGTGAAGNIVVRCDGVETKFVNVAVSSILVRALGGNDSVRYELTGNQTGPMSVIVILGGGNDRFDAVLKGDVLNALSFLVLGGGGRDALSWDATTDVDTSFGGGNLNVIGLGGGGKDSLSFRYKGEHDGKIGVILLGGGSRDQVGAEMTLDLNSGDAVNRSTVTSIVDGDGGRDILFNIIRRDPLDTGIDVSAQMNGGGGRDRGERTANVTPSSVEMDSVVT